MTPLALAKACVSHMPVTPGQMWLDPFRGQGAFFNSFPSTVRREWCEIKEDRDFFLFDQKTDWCVSNPPYSQLDRVLSHSFQCSRVGVAYLLMWHAITPRRIEAAETLGFGLSRIYMMKVVEWFGMTAFCVFEKGKNSIISYDRIVWSSSQSPSTRRLRSREGFFPDP